MTAPNVRTWSRSGTTWDYDEQLLDYFPNPFNLGISNNSSAFSFSPDLTKMVFCTREGDLHFYTYYNGVWTFKRSVKRTIDVYVSSVVWSNENTLYIWNDSTIEVVYLYDIEQRII